MKRNCGHSGRFLLACVLLFSGCADLPKAHVDATPTPHASPLPTALPAYAYDEETLSALQEELRDDRAINPDVCGLLVFQSGLIHAPIVQGSDNEEYLYRDWKTGASSTRGSITLDYRNDPHFQDANSILYGHYVYHRASSDRTLVFTPLEQLLTAENYPNNQYLALIDENEVQYYQIKLVYACRLINVEGGQVAPQQLPFNELSYSEEAFAAYIQAAHAVQYYDTGVEPVYGKRLLTMQTCVEFQPDVREIVLCQELETVTFP